MDKKDFLQFEEDDTSKASANGKQVFVTKRINGKVTHNKEEQKERTIGNILNNEEIIIGLNRVSDNNQNEKQDNQENKRKKKQKKKRSLQKNKQDKKKNKTSNSNNKINKKNKREKKKKVPRILKILIIIVLIAGTTVFAFTSPIFNIQKIEVNGNEKISKETVISLSDIKEETNIFRNSKSVIAEKIKSNPYIDKVEIKRNLPDTIQITVEERKIAYQIKVIDSFVYIDYQGYILEKSSNDAKVPIIEGLHTTTDELLKNARLSDSDISKLNIILKIVDNAKSLDIYNIITKIIIQNNEYQIYFDSSNKTAYLGDETDITNKMLYVEAILNNEKTKAGKIFVNGDLNNGFKTYFREEKN